MQIFWKKCDKSDKIVFFWIGKCKKIAIFSDWKTFAENDNISYPKIVSKMFKFESKHLLNINLLFSWLSTFTGSLVCCGISKFTKFSHSSFVSTFTNPSCLPHSLIHNTLYQPRDYLLIPSSTLTLNPSFPWAPKQERESVKHGCWSTVLWT